MTNARMQKDAKKGKTCGRWVADRCTRDACAPPENLRGRGCSGTRVAWLRLTNRGPECNCFKAGFRQSWGGIYN